MSNSEANTNKKWNNNYLLYYPKRRDVPMSFICNNLFFFAYICFSEIYILNWTDGTLAILICWYMLQWQLRMLNNIKFWLDKGFRLQKKNTWWVTNKKFNFDPRALEKYKNTEFSKKMSLSLHIFLSISTSQSSCDKTILLLCWKEYRLTV